MRWSYGRFHFFALFCLFLLFHSPPHAPDLDRPFNPLSKRCGPNPPRVQLAASKTLCVGVTDDSIKSPFFFSFPRPSGGPCGWTKKGKIFGLICQSFAVLSPLEGCPVPPEAPARSNLLWLSGARINSYRHNGYIHYYYYFYY